MTADLGYDEADFRRLRELGCGLLVTPDELRSVVDQYGYHAEWRADYQIRSVRRSLHSTQITCIDSAVLTYGLLELLFGSATRAHSRGFPGSRGRHAAVAHADS